MKIRYGEDIEQKGKKAPQLPEGRCRRWARRSLQSLAIPATLAMLAFSPVAEHVNPFYSKPAAAEDVSPTDTIAPKKDGEGVALQKTAKSPNPLKNLAVGGKLVVNEAGGAIAATINYGMWVGADVGVITFGERESPYIVLSTSPGLYKKGVKFGYLGKLAFAPTLNSNLYTWHSLYLGYGKQFEKWGFDLGAIAGGALSYPTYDDIYLNLTAGLSFNIKEIFYTYSLARMYFAADNAMQTAYVGFYEPKFQGVEVGMLLKIKEVTGKIYYDYDVVQSKGGIIVGTKFDLTQKLMGYVGGGVGFTQMTPELGGHVSFMAQAFLSLYYVSNSGINQSYKASYEKYGKGGIPLQTDINSPPQLRPLTPEEQAWEATAKQNLLDSDGSMSAFAANYESASKEEIIAVARWLSRTLGEVAYANKAEAALMQLKFFDKSVQDIANASHDDILGFMREYIEWYDAHHTYEGMPQHLLDGIAVCAGIHSTTALFLIKNGIKAAAFSVNTPQEPHVVVGYWTDDETGIIDYGDTFTGPAKSLDQVIRAYGQYKGAPTYITQIFIPKENGGWDYVGTWITPEGRLLNDAMGIDNFHILRSYILDIPGY